MKLIVVDAPPVGARLSLANTGKVDVVEAIKEEVNLNDFLIETQEKKKKLKMIIKADNNGSLEAIVDTLMLHESVDIEQAHIGEVTKSDIFHAKVTGAIIVNFGQNISKDVEQIAKDEKVLIRTYSLIYKLLEEIDDVLNYYQEKDEKQSRFKGQGKIIANFIVENQTIAGVTIQTGKIAVGDEIELYRGETVIGQTKVSTLKQKTKSVQELKKNEEGGMVIEPNLDFKVGDMVKSYSI